jgi:hypothetical protein
MRKLAFVLLVLTCCKAPQEDAHVGEVSEKNKDVASLQMKPKVGNGPFGIDAAMKFEDLDADIAARDSETGLTVLDSAPRPSTQFETIAVVSFPETGVCEIRASSSNFENDPNIVFASSFVEEVAAALKTKYGEAKKNIGCTGYRCESDFKLQGIQDGSYWYQYKWESSKSVKLPNRIADIYLTVQHAEFNNSTVRLDYVFDNKSVCEAAAKMAKASAL